MKRAAVQGVLSDDAIEHRQKRAKFTHLAKAAEIDQQSSRGATRAL
jgi:hypothetical protein